MLTTLCINHSCSSKMLLVQLFVLLFIISTDGAAVGTTFAPDRENSESPKLEQDIIQGLFSDSMLWNNVDYTRRFIAAGAVVDEPNSLGRTGIITASLAPSLDIVRLLIDSGAEFNTIAPCGFTALMAATYSGELPIVDLLIENGADLDLRDAINGETALLFAVKVKAWAIAKSLIRAGASCLIPDKREISPLDIAREQVQQYPRNPEFAEILRMMENSTSGYALK